MGQFLSAFTPENSLKVRLTLIANLTIQINVFAEALLDSDYIDDLDHIIRCFDTTTKQRFRDANEPQYVKFGSARDNDAVHNIRLGQLKLFG
jgi:hypothetical protein